MNRLSCLEGTLRTSSELPDLQSDVAVTTVPVEFHLIIFSSSLCSEVNVDHPSGVYVSWRADAYNVSVFQQPNLINIENFLMIILSCL